MLARLRSRLSYANVIASIALFVALSTGGVYAANEWTGANIVNGSLTNADLALNTIGTGRIHDGTIAAADMADDSITSRSILDGSVTAPDLAADSVGSGEIADGSVTAQDLAADSVGSSEIADDSVTSADLGADSVGSSEIADDSVTSADLAFGSVTASEIATNAVGASEIADNSIDSGEIVDNSLTTADTKGADKSGSVSFASGAIANGRCKDFDVSVSGAATNEAVIFSLKGPAPEGMIFYGVRVKSANVVVLAVCNFTGGTSPAIDGLPVRVVTFG